MITVKLTTFSYCYLFSIFSQLEFAQSCTTLQCLYNPVLLQVLCTVPFYRHFQEVGVELIGLASFPLGLCETV